MTRKLFHKPCDIQQALWRAYLAEHQEKHSIGHAGGGCLSVTCRRPWQLRGKSCPLILQRWRGDTGSREGCLVFRAVRLEGCGWQWLAVVPRGGGASAPRVSSHSWPSSLSRRLPESSSSSAPTSRRSRLFSSLLFPRSSSRSSSPGFSCPLLFDLLFSSSLLLSAGGVCVR